MPKGASSASVVGCAEEAPEVMEGVGSGGRLDDNCSTPESRPLPVRSRPSVAASMNPSPEPAAMAPGAARRALSDRVQLALLAMAGGLALAVVRLLPVLGPVGIGVLAFNAKLFSWIAAACVLLFAG